MKSTTHFDVCWAINRLTHESHDKWLITSITVKHFEALAETNGWFNIPQLFHERKSIEYNVLKGLST